MKAAILVVLLAVVPLAMADEAGTYCPLNGGPGCSGVTIGENLEGAAQDSMFYCDAGAVLGGVPVCQTMHNVDGRYPITVATTGEGKPIVFFTSKNSTVTAGFIPISYFICEEYDCSSVTPGTQDLQFNGMFAVDWDIIERDGERILVLAGAGAFVSAVPGAPPTYVVQYAYCGEAACETFVEIDDITSERVGNTLQTPLLVKITHFGDNDLALMFYPGRSLTTMYVQAEESSASGPHGHEASAKTTANIFDDEIVVVIKCFDAPYCTDKVEDDISTLSSRRISAYNGVRPWNSLWDQFGSNEWPSANMNIVLGTTTAQIPYMAVSATGELYIAIQTHAHTRVSELLTGISRLSGGSFAAQSINFEILRAPGRRRSDGEGSKGMSLEVLHCGTDGDCTRSAPQQRGCRSMNGQRGKCTVPVSIVSVGDTNQEWEFSSAPSTHMTDRTGVLDFTDGDDGFSDASDSAPSSPGRRIVARGGIGSTSANGTQLMGDYSAKNPGGAFAFGVAGNGFPASIGIITQNDPGAAGWSIVLDVCMDQRCNEHVYRYLMDSSALHDNWGVMDDPFNGENRILNHPDGSWTIVLLVGPHGEASVVNRAHDILQRSRSEGSSGKPLFITCLDDTCEDAYLSSSAPNRIQSVIPTRMNWFDPATAYAQVAVNQVFSYAFSGENQENLIVAVRDIGLCESPSFLSGGIYSCVGGDIDIPAVRFWATNRYASPTGYPCDKRAVGSTAVIDGTVYVCSRLNIGHDLSLSGISGWVHYYEWVDLSSGFSSRIWASNAAGPSPMSMLYSYRDEGLGT